MYKTSKLIQDIQSTIDNINNLSLNVTILNEMLKLKITDLFLYSYLRDSILKFQETNLKHVCNENKSIILEVILKRLKYFKNWEYKNNKTIDFINKGLIKSEEIKPFIRFTDFEYADYYQKQNVEMGIKLEMIDENQNQSKGFIPIVLEKHISHSYRRAFAVDTIEFVLGLYDTTFPNSKSKHKWVDIGCGTGLISNAVNSTKFTQRGWDIVGCDLQPNRIKMAKHLSSNNKKYLSIDAFIYLNRIKKERKKIELVSMLEFCEHFADPLNLIEKVAKLNVDIIVIGTPLSQKLDAPFDEERDVVHLWGFTKKSMIKMVESTGYKVFISNESNIGSHLQNDLDWLTIVAAKQNIIEEMKKAFENQRLS